MPFSLRAALLASWGTALLHGHADVDEVVGAVEGDDEPHLVMPEPLSEPAELASALSDYLDAGLLGLRLALPAPGDPLGLTGPPASNTAALAAGEAVIGVPAHGGRPTVAMLVPDVRVFGPPGDHGHCVTWRALDAIATWPDVPTLAQADRDLREQMAEATDALSTLGITSWRPDAREVADALRHAYGAARLPPVAGPRAQALLQRAVQVLGIVEASRDDESGVLTAHASQARLSSLAPLDRAARRALVAASGAVLDSVRR